jgi:hypothetical protein
MTMHRCSRKALRFCTAALSLFLVSCAASTQFYESVEQDISRGKYDSAIQGVRDNRSAYGDKSSVLFNLDLGALYHYAGNPDSSNKYLFLAEREIDDLYTKSISLAAVSLLLNDNVLPYDGEDFERVLLNVFLALNYAEMDQPDEALVEARKVDLKLREYAKNYEGKNRYQEDAFVRYIAGALYESADEVNDAFISYRNAYETYKTYLKDYGTAAPSFLLDDLVRTAAVLSFTEEAERYLALGGKPFDTKSSRRGSILIVAYVGKGPIKQEIRPTVSIPDSAGTLHTFQIALPKFVPRFNGTRSYRIVARARTDSTLTVGAQTEVAENVTAIAAKALDDRLGLLYLKSGGRALLKFLAAEKAKSELTKGSDDKAKNLLGSLAIDLFVGATEQADLRTWRTLPAEFQLARLNLPPGEYTVTIVSSDGAYTLGDVAVHVRESKTSFVIVDDVR